MTSGAWNCFFLEVAKKEFLNIQKGMIDNLATFTGQLVGHNHSRGVTTVHRDSAVDSIVILGQHSGKIMIIK